MYLYGKQDANGSCSYRVSDKASQLQPYFCTNSAESSKYDQSACAKYDRSAKYDACAKYDRSTKYDACEAREPSGYGIGSWQHMFN